MGTIYNLGSINADYFYQVPHLPAPGETLAATALTTGLGGKGANQSVAAARAGARVCHIGAVGPDGAWAITRLREFGVETCAITSTDVPTAHAIINVDPHGENAIVIYPGANQHQDSGTIRQTLATASRGDWLILQNETSHQVEAAGLAHEMGLKIAYSAAPFAPAAVRVLLPYITLLFVNAVEARQLSDALKTPVDHLPVPQILVTKGRDGADWICTNSGETVSVPAFDVPAIDTTGAGDTFAGYAIAGLAQGLSVSDALTRAAAAAALSVTRKGTADAIPTLAEVQSFLASRASA